MFLQMHFSFGWYVFSWNDHSYIWCEWGLEWFLLKLILESTVTYST